MKAIIWDEASQGTKFDYKDIPAELEGTAAEWREKLVEAAAESSEELMNKYLETGSLDEAEINGHPSTHHRWRNPADAVRHRLQEQGRAAHAGRGHRLPAFARGHSPVDGQDDDGNAINRKADDNEKFSALAFKLMSDPFVGQLTFVRVYSGVLKSGDTVYNPIKGKKERIGRILQMHANNREEIKEFWPATSPPWWA